MLSIDLLGPLELRRDGVPLGLGGARQQAVLASLALEPGKTFASDVLVERVWPTGGPVDAVSALQQQVFKLRRVLGAERVERVGGGYRLRREGVSVDALRFERALAEARSAPPGVAVPRLAEARALWRGRALEGLLEHDWAQAESRHLEERRLDAWELHAEGLLELGLAGEASAELERLVGEAPLREPAWLLLMRALRDSGRTADALTAYHDARRCFLDELGIEPSDLLRSLHDEILRHGPSAGGGRHDAAATPSAGSTGRLVGRDADVAAVRQLLASPSGGPVTLTGPAGIGKTSLAVAVARELGGIVVELASLDAPERVMAALAGALDIGSDAGEAQFDVIVAELARRDALLVMDNFEHVLAAAELVARLHQRLPGLRSLVTSRQPLELPDEQVLEVAPLADDDGVTLFVRRVAAARRAELTTPEARPAVAELCRRLDGLPLAIELAAARARHLSVRELMARLDRRLELLHRDGHGVPERRRSLRGALMSSWDLLSPPDKTVFARLGVFAASASLETADGVCGPDALTSLSRLIDASLVRRTEIDDRSRYGMLETVREFALERLTESGDLQHARSLHASAILDFAERARPHLADGARDGSWFARVRDEDEEIRSALSWARACGDGALMLRILVGIRDAWYRSGHRLEGVALAMSALDLVGDDDDLRAEALFTAGLFGADLPTRAAQAHAWLVEALALSDGFRADRAANCLLSLALSAARAGDLGEAERYTRRALALARERDDAVGQSIALSDLANLAMMRRDWEAAGDLSQQALASGVPQASYAELNLAQSLMHRGRRAEAAAPLASSLRTHLEVWDLEGIAYSLEVIAAGAAAGEPHAAARLVAVAGELLERCGTDLQAAEAELHAGTLRQLAERLTDEEIARERAQGLALNTEQACELGLDVISKWSG